MNKSKKIIVTVNPACNHHKDCFAYSRGHCTILNNTDFGDKDCAFYKKDINEIRRN